MWFSVAIAKAAGSQVVTFKVWGICIDSLEVHVGLLSPDFRISDFESQVSAQLQAMRLMSGAGEKGAD